MAEIETMAPERLKAVAQTAARIMTDQQTLTKVRETLVEMITDGEEIDPVTGETRYRRVPR